MRAWMQLAVAMFLVATVFGCGHNPNHDINIEEARKAADRVHPRPDPGVKRVPGFGG